MIIGALWLRQRACATSASTFSLSSESESLVHSLSSIVPFLALVDVQLAVVLVLRLEQLEMTALPQHICMCTLSIRNLSFELSRACEGACCEGDEIRRKAAR